MDIDRVRKLCLSFPGVTEQIQWGDNLVFKIAGKIFAIANLVPAAVYLSFKVTPENFAELPERPGVIPAPYLARAKWVAMQSRDALPVAELAELLRTSYDLVAAKLPRKTRASLDAPASRPMPARPRLRKAKPDKSSSRKKPRK